MKAAKGGRGWKERVSIDAEGSCHRFITCSPLQSSLRHRVREEERTAVSKANGAEERAAEGRKRGTGPAGGGGRRSMKPRCAGEKYRKSESRERCRSGYPPSPCLCFSSLWLSSWPLGSLTRVSAAISQPSPVTLPWLLRDPPPPLPLGAGVCRQQSLNLTLLLYDSAGPVTDCSWQRSCRPSVQGWQTKTRSHMGTPSSHQRVLHPATKQHNAALSAQN